MNSIVLFFTLQARATSDQETKMKLYNTLYTRKPREIPTSHSEN